MINEKNKKPAVDPLAELLRKLTGRATTPAFDPLPELLEELTPVQKEELRRRLNFNVWAQRFEKTIDCVEGEVPKSDAETKTQLGLKFAAQRDKDVEGS